MTEEKNSIPAPDAVCDGGDLDCGSGLLLIIRNAMQPLASGGVLEVRSREGSVKEDLPAWCRMVGHSMIGSETGENRTTHYFIRKKEEDQALQKDLQEARDFTWKARVRWTEGMRAKAFVRNHSFLIGQPASFDTEDPAPGALEYLLSAVAGCLAVGFQWRASQRGIKIFNLEISLQAQVENILLFLGMEEEGSPRLKSVEGRVYVDADAEDGELESLWAETLKKSPVAQSLLAPIPLNIEMRRA